MRWSILHGKRLRSLAGHCRSRLYSCPHNNETGSVSADNYKAYVTKDTRVATILHTSPVTGMSWMLPQLQKSFAM